MGNYIKNTNRTDKGTITERQRSCLMRLITKVHDVFKLDLEILFVAVKIADRYLKLVTTRPTKHMKPCLMTLAITSI